MLLLWQVELAEAYAQAGFYAYPSDKPETSGIALMKAQACDGILGYSRPTSRPLAAVQGWRSRRAGVRLRADHIRPARLRSTRDVRRLGSRAGGARRAHRARPGVAKGVRTEVSPASLQSLDAEFYRRTHLPNLAGTSARSSTRRVVRRESCSSTATE